MSDTSPFALLIRKNIMHSIQRRHLLLASGLAVAPWSTWGQTTRALSVAELSELINKAGSLRMLSQRLAKAWLAIGQNIETKRATRVLQDSVAQFDRVQTDLKPLLPNPATRTAQSQLEPLWNEFKTRLTATAPSQPAALPLLGLDGRVLAQAHQLTQALELYAAQPISELVNLSGRQRMLSQFIAKSHLAMLWKSAPADLHTQVDATRDEFTRNLSRLNAAPQTTPALKQDLLLARQQWVFLESVAGRDERITPKDASEVFVASENLLELMDRITQQYVRLGA